MKRARLLAMGSVGLAACISTPADDDALLTFSGALQGAMLEGTNEAALAFTNDFGNALTLVTGRTQGSFPARFSFTLDEAPPADSLYSLQEGEPTLAFAYITGVRADHPDAVRIANASTGSGGCTQGVCTDIESWCSEGDDPAQDVCYAETNTCDANHQNCTLTTRGDASLKAAPWSTIAGVSSNFAVLYLSAAAPAGSLTSIAFAEGKALRAGYQVLSARPRTDAEEEAASDCYQRSEQRAVALYNQQHGTMLDDIDQLPDDDFEALTIAAQIELRCPQSSKVYTPVSGSGITIQLARDDDALSI